MLRFQSSALAGFEGEHVMGVFVSYSSRDKEAVTRLAQDLQDADEQVWLDQRLAGGDAWWRAILEQIRGCDVFVLRLAVSLLLRVATGQTGRATC
jgi:TIR domain